MAELVPHARVSDIPGWPCPARVRDIPGKQGSWGWIPVRTHGPSVAVACDEQGYLWVNGDTAPRFVIEDPGAIVFWTDAGIGVWFHPRSVSRLASVSQTEMRDPDPGRWLPVRHVTAEPPGFTKPSQRPKPRAADIRP